MVEKFVAIEEAPHLNSISFPLEVAALEDRSNQYLPEQPTTTTSPAPFRWVVYALLPFLAALKSISPVIFTLYLLKKVASEKPTDSVTKITLPFAVWLSVFVSMLWVQWHMNGRRANGHLDLPIPADHPQLMNDRRHLVVALTASLPAFFNGVLASIVLAPETGGSRALARFIALAGVLGSLNWLTWMMTDLQATWRKYVEGAMLKALADQPGVNYLYRNAGALRILLREVYPPVLALIRTRVFDQATQQVLQPLGLQPLLVNAISKLLSLWVYEATALTARNFDIRQMKDGADSAGSVLAMEGWLASSRLHLVRWVGRGLNGQLLADILVKLQLSATASGRIVTAINALGLAAMVQAGLMSFVSVRDTSVLSFYLPLKQASHLSQTLIPLKTTLIILLPALQAYIRAPMVIDQLTKDRLSLQQIVPERPVVNQISV